MLEQAGLKVPQDVSLIGFDDTELCQVVVLRLTTVRQPVGLMGELGLKRCCSKSMQSPSR